MSISELLHHAFDASVLGVRPSRSRLITMITTEVVCRQTRYNLTRDGLPAIRAWFMPQWLQSSRLGRVGFPLSIDATETADQSTQSRDHKKTQGD